MTTSISRLVCVSLAAALLGCAPLQAQRSSGQTDSLRQMVLDLERQVAALNAALQLQTTSIHTLQSTIVAQNNTIAGLNTTVAAQSAKLKFVTVQGTDMYITGANLNIRNGSGSTSGALGAPFNNQPNGLGNLIIGYNEATGNPGQTHAGSHNLVLGEKNTYTSIGGIVAGYSNSITSPYATVTGGAYSTASGTWSSVSGGEGNMAIVQGAAVSGGLGGIAGGRWASVTGGSENTASAESSAVCGGSANTASGLFSTVTGGTGNKVTAQSSSISGGGFVEVDTQFTWAGGSLVSQ